MKKLVHIEQIDDFLYRVAFNDSSRGVFDIRSMETLSAGHSAFVYSGTQDFELRPNRMIALANGAEVSYQWVYDNSSLSEPQGVASYLSTLMDVLNVKPNELATALGATDKAFQAWIKGDSLPTPMQSKLILIMMDTPTTYSLVNKNRTQLTEIWCNSKEREISVIMADEIERKWLIKHGKTIPLDKASITYDISQMYLINMPWLTLRIRTQVHKGSDVFTEQTANKANKSLITFKGRSSKDGLHRKEYEWGLYPFIAKACQRVFKRKCIIKTRHVFFCSDGLCFEVDVFKGQLEGMTLIEMEIPSINTLIPDADWLGVEVTGDERLYNASMVKLDSTQIDSLISDLKLLQLQKR